MKRLFTRIAISLTVSMTTHVTVYAQKEALRVDDKGNVGIGVGNPKNTVDIKSGSERTTSNHPSGLGFYLTHKGEKFAEFRNDEGTQGVGIQADGLYAAGSTDQSLNLKNKLGSISFLTKDVARMTIGKEGNIFISSKIGIGNDNPKALLDVGIFPDKEEGSLATVFGRLKEGNESGEGTYLGVQTFRTQPWYNVKSFAIEHRFYGRLNSSINFYRGSDSDDGFITFSTTPRNEERMRIQSNGYIGMGTNSPQYPLEVWHQDTKVIDDFGYLNKKGIAGHAGKLSKNISVYAHGAFATGDEFYALSDARVKKDLKPSLGTTDVDLLKHLQVTDFKYIDNVDHGDQYKKGFIAQQVESVFPEAVTKGSDFIPNIFSAPVKISASGSSVVFTMDKPHQLVVGDEVRVFSQSGMHQVVVTQVNSDSFAIKGAMQDYTQAFVLGKKVNDFRMVDYDRLFTLNVSATQELIRKVEKLEAENKQMKEAYTSLAQKVNQIETSMFAAKNNSAVQLTASK